MIDIELTDGSPVPEDRSHTEINPATGQQRGYVVLTAEERAKGFVKPIRSSYRHKTCGGTTTMGRSLCETYARDPYFYSGTFCITCGAHFDLSEFNWSDGEPMDPLKQDEWAKQKRVDEINRRRERIMVLRRELEELESALAAESGQSAPIEKENKT